MSKKAMFVWCIFLGALDGVYCVICAMIPHVQNYMWIGFISLPIFFAAGADNKMLPQMGVCSICGVLWGKLTLIMMGLVPIGNGTVTMFIWVTIVVLFACFVHMSLLDASKCGGLFASAPAMFGGFAACFSQGGANAELPWVCLTLILGLALGGIMVLAGGVAAKVDGPGASE